MTTLPWIVWGILCTFAVRFALLRLVGRRAGTLAFLIVYPVGIAMFVVGTLVMWATGFDMYRYERLDTAQRIGYFVFIWSPLGLPLLLGAPFVIAYDLGRSLVRAFQPGSKGA